MLKKKIIKIFRSIAKLFLPIIFKLLINFKLNRRVINFLQEKSYFSNNAYNFYEEIKSLLKNNKIVALDVGAQGGFNSDEFFPSRYNNFFDCVLVEPIQSEVKKLKNNKFVINKALWSSKIKKQVHILDNRLGSSSMYKPDEEKFDLHDINKDEFEKFKVTRTIDVECDTIENSLKELNIKSLDYLKIDTQGAELEILKGIGNYRPVLIKIEAHIFSMYKDTPEWSQLLNCLYELNYLIIDWKGIGKHKTRIAAEIDLLFIPNFNNQDGKKKIVDNLNKFTSLLLIFGQLSILKTILKRLNIKTVNIDKYEDLYFN